MKELAYLENLEKSSEHIFAYWHADKINLFSITYISAFNLVGMRFFKRKWTEREFFAAGNTTDIIQNAVDRGLYYSLYHNENERILAALRAQEAMFFLNSYLAEGKLLAFYLNHYTGEEFPLTPEFWRSTKSDYTRITGRIKNPENKDNRPIPGKDFLVFIKSDNFKKMIAHFPTGSRKPASKSNSERFGTAQKIILKKCADSGVVLNRVIYHEAMNLLLNEEHYDPNNDSSDWKNVPKEFKNKPGIKNPKFLNLKDLKSSKDSA